MEFFDRANHNHCPTSLFQKLFDLELQVSEFAATRTDIENIEKFLRLIHKEQRNFNDTVVRAIQNSNRSNKLNNVSNIGTYKAQSRYTCLDQLYEDLEFEAELDSILQDLRFDNDNSSQNQSSSDLCEQSQQVEENQLSEDDLQEVDENLLERFKEQILDCPEFQKRAQGVLNNYNGFALEFEAMKDAPGVTSVHKVFNSLHQAVVAKQDQMQQVQVDIVCHGGFAWLEVKDYQDAFDIHSSQWNGRPRHIKGLKHQLSERIHVAQAPCNTVRWVQPKVVVYFRGSCLPCLRREIEKMGALVVNSLQELNDLKIQPALPEGRNLDITALCAMVSQVSYEEGSERIRKWAQNNMHWQGCVTKESQDPMLSLFQKQLFDRPMIAAKSAVTSFEELVDKFAGTTERERWESWKSHIRIIDDAQQINRSGRIDRLNLGQLQKNVFSVGDKFKHITFTANMRAVRSTIAQGVQLEAIVHRAVWLTGI